MRPRILLSMLGWCAIGFPVAGAPHRVATSNAGTESAPAEAPAVIDWATVPAPTIYGKSALIVDAITGQVIHEKNATEHRQVASTQKLMTALLIAEAGGLDREIVVDAVDSKCQPVKLFLKEGEVYKRRDLLRALLMKSANDAARCLGRAHAGTEVAFGEMMTARAKKLGMKNTHFSNASGLPDETQYSTARDMAKLARAALQNPLIRTLVSTKFSTFTMADKREKELVNTNRLLHELEFVHGMKTGYTDAAGKCLISYATLKNRKIIVVVLGSSDSMIWKDSKSLINWALRIPPPTPIKKKHT